MAKKKVIDLDTYNALDAWCIALNEYFKSLRKAGFSEGTPEDLPPARRERYDASGRNSKVLVKKLR